MDYFEELDEELVQKILLTAQIIDREAQSICDDVAKLIEQAEKAEYDEEDLETLVIYAFLTNALKLIAAVTYRMGSGEDLTDEETELLGKFNDMGIRMGISDEDIADVISALS